MDSLLTHLLPPRNWSEPSGVWLQHVSPYLSTREDIMRLQSNLEQELDEREARYIPICPVREDLFSQAFDELIRQVVIECPERGVLLYRVRDQFRMTISCYQTLYNNSTLYSLQKSVDTWKCIPAIEKRIQNLEKRRNDLKCQVINLQRQVEYLQEKEEKLSEDQQEKYEEEAAQKQKNKHLDAIVKANEGATDLGQKEDEAAKAEKKKNEEDEEEDENPQEDGQPESNNDSNNNNNNATAPTNETTTKPTDNNNNNNNQVEEKKEEAKS